MNSILNARAFSMLSWVLVLGTAAGAAYMLYLGRELAAGWLAGFAVLAVAFIVQRDTLPSIFSFLFVLAGTVNAAGYAIDLWTEAIWFDELVHVYTSFTVMAAIGWLAFRQTRVNAAGRSARFVAAVAALGLLLGVLWEVFEWMISIIGSRTDTLIDLGMDLAGAVAAGLFCSWVAATERGSARVLTPIKEADRARA